MDDYAACCDDAAVPDSYSRTDNDSAAYPAIFSNADGKGRLLRFASLYVVCRVARRVELAVGADFCVRTDMDASAVEHCAVVVDEHVFAKMNFCAVVTVERRADECRFGYLRYELFDCTAVVGVGNRHCLQTCAEPLAAGDVAVISGSEK